MPFPIHNVYYYQSPVCTFYIIFNERTNKWELIVQDECYGVSEDPVALADNVYCTSTGFYQWDSFDISAILAEVPTDIHQWNYLERA